MASDDAGTEGSPSSPNLGARLREAIVLGIIGTALIGWLLIGSKRKPPNADDEIRGATAAHPANFSRDDFLGDDSCAECHPSIGVYHSMNGHSRTFRPAADRALAGRLDGQFVADPERPGVSWAFLLDDGRFAVERREGEQVDRLPVDFAFGSGYHATTFISLLDAGEGGVPAIREHRMTHNSDGSIRVTPGQGANAPNPGTDVFGRVLRGDEALDCITCHVTLTSATDSRTVDVRAMIPNVSCERCHGPGRAHVEAARRGVDPDSEALAMPFGPGRYSADDQMRLCGACHRHPSEAPFNAIRPDNAELSRFQPVGLMQSACYTQSNGALSCTTCHDSHRRPEADPASYTTTCLSCHTPSHPGQAPCPVSPTQGCTSCHMPRVDSGQGIDFADHWIRVRDDLPDPPAEHPIGTDRSGTPGR